jgi:hypothetical protein
MSLIRACFFPRSPQEEILDSPGRDTELPRKRYWTPQEEIPNSPGRDTELPRKKYWTPQEEIPNSPGSTSPVFPAKLAVLEGDSVALFLSCYIVLV